MDLRASDSRLSCPFCGFDVTDLLLGNPDGFIVGVGAAITNGLPCCGDHPTNAEVRAWVRQLTGGGNLLRVDALLAKRVM